MFNDRGIIMNLFVFGVDLSNYKHLLEKWLIIEQTNDKVLLQEFAIECKKIREYNNKSVYRQC